MKPCAISFVNAWRRIIRTMWSLPAQWHSGRDCFRAKRRAGIAPLARHRLATQPRRFNTAKASEHFDCSRNQPERSQPEQRPGRPRLFPGSGAGDVEREIMSSLIEKGRELLKRPDQALTRIGNRLQSLLDKPSKACSLQASAVPAAADERLAELLGSECRDYLAGIGLEEFEDELHRTRLEPGGDQSRFSAGFNGTTTFGRLCYASCRALRPAVAVETGVAHGVTSAYILRAMRDNGVGKLYSIDLPPLAPGAENTVGAFIPQSLRNRWELRMGDARKLLP